MTPVWRSVRPFLRPPAVGAMVRVAGAVDVVGQPGLGRVEGADLRESATGVLGGNGLTPRPVASALGIRDSVRSAGCPLLLIALGR